MNKIYPAIVLLLGLALYGCGSGKIEKVAEKWPNGKPKVEGQLKKVEGSDPIKIGKWSEWYENGNKKNEVEYKDGILNGKYWFWYESGKRKEEGRYIDGAIDGTISSWYENGQKGVEIDCRKGKKEGDYVSWFENGRKQEEASYKDDKLDGEYSAWYENGEKRLEANIAMGVLDGKVVVWYENGEKMKQGSYKSGKLEGKWVVWHPNGEKQLVSKWNDGKLIGEANAWDDKGNVIDASGMIGVFKEVLAYLERSVAGYGISDQDEGKSETTGAVLQTQEYSGEPDFRDAYWGMTQQEVMKVENDATLTEMSKKYPNKGVLVYDGKLGDYSVMIQYIFDSDTGKLVSGSYGFHSPSISNAAYRNQFLSRTSAYFEAQLSAKYGKPDKIEERDSFTEASLQSKMPSLNIQNVNVIIKWETTRKVIYIEMPCAFLEGELSSIACLTLRYDSKEYYRKSQEDKIREASKLEIKQDQKRRNIHSNL